MKRMQLSDHSPWSKPSMFHFFFEEKIIFQNKLGKKFLGFVTIFEVKGRTTTKMSRTFLVEKWGIEYCF